MGPFSGRQQMKREWEREIREIAIKMGKPSKESMEKWGNFNVDLDQMDHKRGGTLLDYFFKGFVFFNGISLK